LERGKRCLPNPTKGWFNEHQLKEGIRKEDNFELFSNLIESNVKDNYQKIDNDGLHLLVLIISKSYLFPKFILILF
jgi:hypothetical protein